MEAARGNATFQGRAEEKGAVIWRDWGGSGPLLHFAHANGFPPGTYRKLITDLSQNHHVVSMAGRPLWRESTPTVLHDWSLFADDLRTELDRRSLRGVIGVGHSLGGVISLLAAAADPGIFSAVVAVDPLILTGRLSLEDFVRHLAAADVILSLRFPSHGEISGALVRALGVGRPVLVTAGTPAAHEFPEGVVLPVDPGPSEPDELVALLRELLMDASLRSAIGRLARNHVLQHHTLEETVARLAGFLRKVHAGKPAMLRSLRSERVDEGSLLGYLTEEVRWGARELGLPGLQLGLGTLLEELVGSSG